MIKTVFTILLCVHLLGDFYFQTQRMADRKREKFSWTICHSFAYAVCSLLLFFLLLPGMKLRYMLAFVLAHAFIDIVKYAACRFLSGKRLFTDSAPNSRNVFLLDQAAHLLTILGIAFWMRTADCAELYRAGAGVFLMLSAFPRQNSSDGRLLFCSSTNRRIF